MAHEYDLSVPKDCLPVLTNITNTIEDTQLYWRIISDKMRNSITKYYENVVIK